MPRIWMAALLAAFSVASAPAFAQASFEGEDSATTAGGGNVTRTWHRLRDATNRRNEHLQRPSWTVGTPGRADTAIGIERTRLPIRSDRAGQRRAPLTLDRPRILDRPHVLDRPQPSNRQY